MKNKSGLPKAIVPQKNIKIWKIEIKAEKPQQSLQAAKSAISRLEKAAKEKVFTTNELLI